MPAPFAASNLSYSQRRDLVASALRDKAGSSCYVSDLYDTYVTYTIYDYNDGGSTLYRADYSIADDYSVTLGTAQEVIATTQYEPVVAMSAFSVAAKPTRTVNGLNIYEGARLFRIGSYPDKGVPAVTVDDLEAIADSFEVGCAPLDFAHDMDSPTAEKLKGQFGGVERVWVDGEWLKGDVAIATWFDAMLTPAERQLSVYLDQANWQLNGLALTDNPRVQGAALFAAFSAATTPTNTNRPSAASQRLTAPKGSPMKVTWDKIVALFTGAGYEIEGVPAPASATATAAAPSAPVPDAKFAALEEENKNLKRAGIDAAAVAFADSLSARILPAERPSVIIAYKRAAEDDLAAPTRVKFSGADGSEIEGSRVDLLQATYTARPEHGLTAEMIEGKPTDAILMSAKTNTSQADNGISTGNIYAARRKQTKQAAQGGNSDAE